MSISKRDAMLTATADRKFMSLWLEYVRLYAELDTINKQCDDIKAALPQWARELPGVAVTVAGRLPCPCLTVEDIDAAVGLLRFPDAESRGRYRGGKVAELNEARRRFDAERQRSGYSTKIAESEATCEAINRVEEQMSDIQAVTAAGLSVQALLFADLRKYDDPEDSVARLARSMGLAAKRIFGAGSLAAT